MNAADDTIVAVSTPAGHAERAVVRLSGPEALACVADRFAPDCGTPAGGWSATFRATRGRLLLRGPGARCPCLLYVMRAPHSYTRDDVVELHLPGSPALLDLVLDDLLAHGPGAVRLAEPGEFTRRAFLNGRIDLAQAEAVLALVRARTEAELVAAASKLRGSVGRQCAALQRQVTDLRVQTEAELDFAEHGIELLPREGFLARCAALRRRIGREAAAGRGEVASDGHVHAVICGAPNVGKSSLLNRLAGQEAAIVHPRAGTTRDAVHAEVRIGAAGFRLTDTAGLMGGAAGPDAEAVRRARAAIRASRLLILVLDGSQAAPPGALEPARLLPRERVLCVISKCDLPQRLDEGALGLPQCAWQVLHTSALSGEGMDALREALWRAVAEGRLDASPADCLCNARQRHALRRAVAELARAERAVRDGLGYEFAAVNLRAAGDALGEVTGEVTSQDVLDGIFRQFCIGK